MKSLSTLWTAVLTFARRELAGLAHIHPSDRPWQMPFAAALASGLPIAVGASFDHLNYGLVSSLGGLVFLYLPDTPLHHRMVSLMACSFGMAACYALGILSQFVPPLMTPVLIFIAISVTMICRYYRLGPPGSLFFIMAASIGAYSPVDILEVPMRVGLLIMGCLLAGLIALVYSLHMSLLRTPRPVPPVEPASFDFVVFDPVVIGAFVGVSLALGQALAMPSPYWVPVSCLAVIQGISVRAVWDRQLHRIVGTGFGILVAWGLLTLPLDKWSICVMMTALAFVIETLVVRNYGMAVVFITPLTIFLVEAGGFGPGMPSTLIEARLLDTILGSAVGLAGGICLHSPGFRRRGGALLRRVIPSRLMP
ncbi:Fusaric acid resistance protein-like [Magnetospirillum fulvum]|uniref:Fusaric acid resistance protein-like n=1 Tax=Magnetospirillum fulvum TaxID=1082 RepID=A0A1H6I5W7_MAGFU|nr:Fusaric acid resistance protein-like [Magnetospirillum fulvum]